MVTITENAQKKILELMQGTGKPVKGLRVRAETKTPLKVNYQLAFILDGQQEPDDTVAEFDGFSAFVDPKSLPHVEDAVVDFVDNGLTGSGFKVDAPRKLPPHLTGPVAQRVQTIIDERINPSIAGHGGFVALADIKEDVVYLQFGGGCHGCGMADVTLKQGVAVMIKEAVPEIKDVRDVTDHGQGKNPYYQPGQTG